MYRGKAIKTDQPCPACGSNAGAIYENQKVGGDKFYMYSCFSSSHEDYKNDISISSPSTYYNDVLIKLGLEEGHVETTQPVKTDPKPSGGYIKVHEDTIKFMDLKDKSAPWGDRGLHKSTCEYYGVSLQNVSFNKGTAVAPNNIVEATVAFHYYDQSGKTLVASKLRSKSYPKGVWKKEDGFRVDEGGLFGQHLANPAIHPKIAVTFGEFDAMAVWQMIGGVMPVVSVKNGDRAAPKDFDASYDFLKQFDQIILVPDNDGKCEMVIPVLGSKFMKKTKIVKLTKEGLKDANDYLLAGETTEFKKLFWSPTSFNPEKIYPLSRLTAELFKEPPRPLASYPWDGLNKKAGGIYAGDLITVLAYPKVGKSTVISQIADHLYKTTDYNIGLIYLEETPRDLIFRFATLHFGKNYQSEDAWSSVTDMELNEFADRLIKEDRLFYVEHWGSCSSSFLEEKITEFIVAKNCRMVFFDHISMAITDESNKDERLALDRTIARIKELTVGVADLDEDGNQIIVQPAIIMVSHVNDDGKPRGSRAALQQSNLVISLKRDKQAATISERNKMQIIVEENRRHGRTGLACVLNFDYNSGILTEEPILSDDEKASEADGYVYKPKPNLMSVN